MATYNAFNKFVEDLAHKVHDLSNDTIKVALCNAAPVATNSVLADLTTVSLADLDDDECTVSDSSQTSGTYKLTIADKTLLSNGTVGPFRYIVLYNSTPATDPLICWYDYGSELTLDTDESLLIDFDDAGGALTIGACS